MNLGHIPENSHAVLRQVYEYWLSIAPPGRLPGRRELDPVAIPRLLSHLGLIDVARDPWEFRVRLVGTETVNALERDRTGLCLDHEFPEFHHTILRRKLIETAETRQPTWYAGRPELPPDRSFIPIERACFPLATDGVTVDMILTATVFFDSARHRRD